jgi:hypothetical protein
VRLPIVVSWSNSLLFDLIVEVTSYALMFIGQDYCCS